MSDLTTKIFRDTLTVLEECLKQDNPIKDNIEECLDLLLKLSLAPAWHWGRVANLELNDIQRVTSLEPAMSALRAGGAMTLYSNLVDLLEPKSQRLEFVKAFTVLCDPNSSEEQVVYAQGLITDAWDYEGLDLTDEQIEIIFDFAGIRTKDFEELILELLPEPPNWESFEEEPVRELVAV